MRRELRFSLGMAALAFAASQASTLAQCLPQWTAMPQPTYGATSFGVWDPDGPGPARSRLVAGSAVRTVSFDPMGIIRQWDGRRWLPIGDGLIGWRVYAIIASDTSGVGSPAPGLYASGLFTDPSVTVGWYAMHFDGRDWRPLGEGLRGAAYSWAMFDEDGPGPDEANLFLGGSFNEAAGREYPGIVRWDGTGYSLVGGSLTTWHPRVFASVHAMTVFDDDGPGPRPPALYVGGSFNYAGGIEVNNIARWDGTNWEALGTGVGAGVQALTVFDPDGDGPGLPMLYAGGQFVRAGTQAIFALAKWDGQEWSGVGSYNGGGVKALITHDDDGDGPNKESLFITGYFYEINGVTAWGVARWDGANWHDLDIGLNGLDPSADAFGLFDEDGDPATPPGLYVGGGGFAWAGGGTIWSPALVRWGCPYPACYPDCDLSGTLDIFDFLCFQNSFVSGEPYACDCHPEPACDIFDFLCFQSAFVSGCP